MEQPEEPPESSAASMRAQLGLEARAEGRDNYAHEATNGTYGSEPGKRGASRDAAGGEEASGRQEIAAGSSRAPEGSQAELRGLPAEATSRESEAEHRHGSHPAMVAPGVGDGCGPALDGSDDRSRRDDDSCLQAMPAKDEPPPVSKPLGQLASELQGVEPLGQLASEPQGVEPQGQLKAQARRHRKVERQRVAVKKLEALALQGFNEWLVRGQGEGEGGVCCH